nr:transposase [Halalkalirubrum salinum]
MIARPSDSQPNLISRQLVREAVENDCTAIAFENLKHIRTRISNASKFQQWAFRELQRHVEYKAEECGIDVDDVTPAYTSQRCSHGECGFTHEDNRNGDEFECRKHSTVDLPLYFIIDSYIYQIDVRNSTRCG